MRWRRKTCLCFRLSVIRGNCCAATTLWTCGCRVKGQEKVTVYPVGPASRELNMPSVQHWNFIRQNRGDWATILTFLHQNGPNKEGEFYCESVVFLRDSPLFRPPRNYAESQGRDEEWSEPSIWRVSVVRQFCSNCEQKFPRKVRTITAARCATNCMDIIVVWVSRREGASSERALGSLVVLSPWLRRSPSQILILLLFIWWCLLRRG